MGRRSRSWWLCPAIVVVVPRDHRHAFARMGFVVSHEESRLSHRTRSIRGELAWPGAGRSWPAVGRGSGSGF